MNWQIFALLLAAAWGLQALLTVRQIRSYRRRLQELREWARGGYVGVGTAAGRLRPGAVVLLAADGNGQVVRAERMRGRTVFARFEPLPEIEGVDVSELGGQSAWMEPLDWSTVKAVRMAADLIVKRIADARDSASRPGADPDAEVSIERGGEPASDEQSQAELTSIRNP